jgi:hypothetical protein
LRASALSYQAAAMLAVFRLSDKLLLAKTAASSYLKQDLAKKTRLIEQYIFSFLLKVTELTACLVTYYKKDT